MDTNKIHFIREILLTDNRGKETPTMQFSYDNASYLLPTYLLVPSADQARIHALYLKLGGSRSEGRESGTVVVIPNRSAWARWWPISVEEVQVVAGTDSQARLPLAHQLPGRSED